MKILIASDIHGSAKYCRLLLERKQSISEIAYATGFATPSYFAATFRHVIGCTPTEYIKRNTPA